MTSLIFLRLSQVGVYIFSHKFIFVPSSKLIYGTKIRISPLCFLGAMKLEAAKFRPREVVKHVLQTAAASLQKLLTLEGNIADDVPVEVNDIDPNGIQERMV